MARVKERARKENVSFKALVIRSLEDTLSEEKEVSFHLRDASAGGTGDRTVSAEKINRLIDDSREPGFSS